MSNVLNISTASCLTKRPRQTDQTQTRLLLMKQSDQCLSCLLFEHFFNSALIANNVQEVFHVYLNKFENAITHLFLIIFGND